MRDTEMVVRERPQIVSLDDESASDHENVGGQESVSDHESVSYSQTI